MTLFAAEKNARRTASQIAIFCLAVLVALPVCARGDDRRQPMDVNANASNTLLTDDGDSELIGDVEIRQGTLAIDANHALISRSDGEVRRVVLTGAPATLSQQDDQGQKMTAHAAKIDYNLSSDRVLLTGNVEVLRPRGTLRGERIEYNIATGQLNAGDADGSSGRIFMRIEPKADAAAGS